VSERVAIVTGASGIIGRALVPMLESAGWSVIKVGRSSAVTWDALWSLDLANVALVFHLAAYVPPAMEDSTHARECLEVNALLSLRLAEHLARHSRARLVQASTGQIYGFNHSPVREDSVTQPMSRACFYLSSKLLAETYIQRTTMHMGLLSTIVRIGNVYGPGMKAGALIAWFSKLASEGKALPLRHGGSERFDLVEVTDVARCLMRAASHNGVFHAGTGTAHSVREVAEIVNAVFGNAAGIDLVEPHEKPRQPGFAPLDMTKSRESLCIDPVPLEVGVRMYRTWLESAR